MILIIREWLVENNIPLYRHAYDIIHIPGNIALKINNDALYIRIANTGYNNVDTIISMRLEYINHDFLDELLKLIKKHRKSNIYLATRKATISVCWLLINSMIYILAAIWPIIILIIAVIILSVYFSYKFICGD